MSRFYQVTVSDIRRETRDAVVVSLAIPDEHKQEFRFTPGQYLTFRAMIDGEEVRRCYSICAGADDGVCRVAIKKAPEGRFSIWANEAMRPGQQLDAMPPMGNFHVPLDPAHRNHYVGFAAGSGITPLLSIIKTTLAREPHSRFSLFYGNRASSTIMFREELEDLKNQHLSRFSITHILSREHQELDLFNGRIGRDKCRQLFTHWLDVGTVDTAFICGPQQMMLEVAETLQEHGLDRNRIKFELFDSNSAGSRRRAPQSEAAAKPDLCQATVKLDGRARHFAFAKNTLSLLEAALQEGLEAPHACKAGVCSTCRALLVEGQADMDANYALEDYEVARGYILTCQAYPVSDTIIVDYDS